MASFPGAVKTFTVRANGQTIADTWFNEPDDEITAIEDGLRNGTAPLNSSNSTFTNLSITGGSTVTGTLTVGGNSSLTGALHVGGASTFVGAVTVTGGQILFPAAQNASAGANTLDDYEEGTWTPVLGGTGGSTGQTYTRQVGTYIKVGKHVTAYFTVQFSAKGTITTAAQLQGLPFTVENTANYFGSVVVTYWDSLAVAKSYIGGLCNAAATTADLYCVASTPGVSMVTLVTADIGNTTQLVGAVVYRATG